MLVFGGVTVGSFIPKKVEAFSPTYFLVLFEDEDSHLVNL